MSALQLMKPLSPQMQMCFEISSVNAKADMARSVRKSNSVLFFQVLNQAAESYLHFVSERSAILDLCTPFTLSITDGRKPVIGIAIHRFAAPCGRRSFAFHCQHIDRIRVTPREPSQC